MFKGITIKDYMTTHLITFSPEQDIMEVVNALLDKRISGGPVVDRRGRLVGMISEKDCIAVVLQAGYNSNDMGGQVKDYMTSVARTVNSDDSLVDVARLFSQDSFRRYPVMRDNLLVGQISRRDILRALKDLAKRNG